jgi:hypothetical protein
LRGRPAQVSFAVSDFARGGRTEENWAELFNLHPLLAKLGRGEAPSLRRSNLEDVRLLDRDRSYYDAQRELGLPRVTTGDWRCAQRAAVASRCGVRWARWSVVCAGCKPARGPACLSRPRASSERASVRK